MKKCDNLMLYNFLRPTYLAVSTMMIVCNIYLLHIFLDLLPLEPGDSIFKPLLSFTVRFIIFYGWPKAVTMEYLPIGRPFFIFSFVFRNLADISTFFSLCN